MYVNRRKFIKGSMVMGTMGVMLLNIGCKSDKSSGGNTVSGSALESYPSLDGFRMPGEFEPHEAIWLVWPEQPEWRLKGKHAEKVYVELAAAIAGDISVRLAVTKDKAARVRSLMPSNVEIIEMDAGTGWIRDDGPTFLINDAGKRRGVDWVFNGWGFPEENDDQSDTAEKLLARESAPRYRAPLVLEGGSIHSDGRGTIITTEECLLNPNRNPDLDKQQIEEQLKNYLGARKVIWLPRGVFEDSTSGHVDNMCCFIKPSEVMLTWTDDKTDPQYQRSREALDVLEASTDADGASFTVHKLHQPGPLFVTAAERDSMPESREGEIENRMPASYINYILTNKRLIFPLLDPTTDEQAKQTFQHAFPFHEIIGVAGREILLHGGNFHCISQNLPKP